MGETLLFGVDDDIDAALAEQRHILVLVPRRFRKAHRDQQPGKLLHFALIGRELDEFEALD
jgi:hypothetical protein